jgi:hypothetical protein
MANGLISFASPYSKSDPQSVVQHRPVSHLLGSFVSPFEQRHEVQNMDTFYQNLSED